MSGTLESGMRVGFAAGRAFEPRLDIDLLTDGRLALIDSIGYRVKLIGLDGSVTGTIERPIAPLPVDDEIREAERERYREAEAGVLGSARNTNLPIQIDREGVEGRTFADEVPVLYGLKVDWEDRIWVEPPRSDGRRRRPDRHRDARWGLHRHVAAGWATDAGGLRPRRAHGLHRARRPGCAHRPRGQADGAGAARARALRPLA